MNGRTLLKISVLVLSLSGCATPSTYKQEVCREYDTQWDWACPKNYIVIEGEGIKLPEGEYK
jgi:hypothetical protein